MTEGSCSPHSGDRSIPLSFRLDFLPFIFLSVAALIVALTCTVTASAQDAGANGKLKIHVHPKQAYVFVDGKAIRDGSQTIELTAGDHKVGVYNYGYLPKLQDVHIAAGETTRMDVALQASGDRVSGPFGYIEFKGPGRAAVLLNGTTPDYFVGHVDEFDWDWIWHQRLLVHPGTYQVTVTREGNTIWSGPVSVQADEKVVVYLDDNGRMKTKHWSTGSELGNLPRFSAGIASATVPVAPVKAQLAAQPAEISCGQSTALDWKTTDAVAATITSLGNVPASGERTVSPMRTVNYEITAKGPGGVVTKTVTVDVNTQPTASLTISRPEVHFHKVGDKVVSDDSATLQWSTSNADHVTISHVGSVAANGSRTITADPERTTAGPVDQDMTYQLTSTNECGGSVTRMATLHVAGSIDPAPPVTLASLFYPTNYPTAKHAGVGLVATEQQELAEAAARFRSHAEYDGQARLLVVGHADVRGSKKHNMKLSERRAELVKDYLVSKGVSADKIEIRAEGKEQQLSRKQVAMLQAKDTEKPEKWMMRKSKDTWLAYNRRVDIILEPSGVQSAKAYPNDAPDARILWQPAQPKLHAVEVAARTPERAKGARSTGAGH
jgi:hypothetical protein